MKIRLVQLVSKLEAYFGANCYVTYKLSMFIENCISQNDLEFNRASGSRKPSFYLITCIHQTELLMILEAVSGNLAKHTFLRRIKVTLSFYSVFLL